MAINGLITKVIFDHNPDREFYVEESFPLEWMYPYLEPHGLIMKLNRQPLARLPAETLARDHEYWRKLVASMLGDWLNEQTPASEVAAFVDRVYVRHDLKGFTGDPMFIHNDYAKKSFSKLRSSIAGVYAWRLSTNAPPEYRSNINGGALLAETDFAFRQAIALCPYSPEALFRYVNWLLQIKEINEAVLETVPMLRDLPIIAQDNAQRSNRVELAVLLTETFLKVDPENKQARSLLENLKSYKKQSAGTAKPQN
jgi:hypothetical protein